jgi:hypothetical protein
MAAGGTPIRGKLIRAGLVAAVAAGTAGLVLELAGVSAPAVSVLVVLFIVVAPSTAIAGLLGGFDRSARVVLAGVTTLVLLIALAMVMLSIGAWSPRGGLAALAVITAVLFAAGQVPASRLRALSPARLSRRRQERPSGGTAGEPTQAGATGPGRREP